MNTVFMSKNTSYLLMLHFGNIFFNPHIHPLCKAWLTQAFRGNKIIPRIDSRDAAISRPDITIRFKTHIISHAKNVDKMMPKILYTTFNLLDIFTFCLITTDANTT